MLHKKVNTHYNLIILIIFGVEGEIPWDDYIPEEGSAINGYFFDTRLIENCTKTEFVV